MASFSTIAVETRAGGATGALCGSLSSTADQLQKWTHTERGNSSGLCAPIPAVVYDDMQACELGRGDVSPVLSRIPHRLGFLLPSRRPVRCPSRCIGHHLPGCAVLAAPGTFHSSRNRACKPFARRQSLPTQQILQSIADRRHLSNLSKSGSSAGFKTSWKDLTCEAEPLSPDDKIHD